MSCSPGKHGTHAERGRLHYVPGRVVDLALATPARGVTRVDAECA